MRPRKVIRLLDLDESRQSCTRLLLDVHLYSVDPDVHQRHRHECPDLILGYWPLDEQNLAELGLRWHCPTLLVVCGKRPATLACLAHQTLLNPTAEQLLEAVKLMCSRKRGPRKGTPRKEPVSDGRPDPHQSEVPA